MHKTFCGVEADYGMPRAAAFDALKSVQFNGRIIFPGDFELKYQETRAHVGAADASNVVLADRYQTRTIATLDRRHFSVLRPIGGGRFAVVP